MTITEDFEVVIIGGSYAGLSAALALGRSLRTVLIIDSGLPCNRQTPHSHNFLTQDGKTPKEISSLALEQVLKYETVKFHRGLAVSGRKTTMGFEIQTATNENFRAQKLIFATGIKDSIPHIKGFEECWGISIIHCPYCHGFEHRTQSTGIIANGAKAFHIASLVSNLTDNLTILTTGKPDFDNEQMEKLNNHNIKIIETPIVEIENLNGHLQSVVLDDGSKVWFEVAYAVVPFVQHSNIPASLGCQITEHGYLKVDAFQKTNIEGIYVCGDSSNMMRSVAQAVYSGNLTGAVVNGELSQEHF